jgi:hypothetical protein
MRSPGVIGRMLRVYMSMSPFVLSMAREQPPSFLRKLQTGSDVDFSCNVAADKCGLKFNGQCDDTNGAEDCIDGDCFDCDLCRQFNYDCNSCIQQTGCLWCPGEAQCFNSFRYIISSSSCQGLDDYTDDSCSVPGEENFFEYVKARKYPLMLVPEIWKVRISLTFYIVCFVLTFQRSHVFGTTMGLRYGKRPGRLGKGVFR